MTESIHRKPTQSATLLIGILLTLLAVVGHRFLPERRLTIDSAREGANFFPVPMGHGAPADFQWIDQANFHYSCRFPQQEAYQGCGFAYMLSKAIASQGIDLSRFNTLNLTVRYSGNAQYLRVGIRNFDRRFSKIEDLNSPKFNFVNIPTGDLAQPLAISLSEFAVAEWWTAAYNLPREYSRPDLSSSQRRSAGRSRRDRARDSAREDRVRGRLDQRGVLVLGSSVHVDGPRHGVRHVAVADDATRASRAAAADRRARA